MIKTMQDVAPRAYVTGGQGKFSMYTSAPTGTKEPSVPVSPPPWDGSAEGYSMTPGPGYGLYEGGCAGCGYGGMPWPEQWETAFKVGGAMLGIYLLYLVLKKR